MQFLHSDKPDSRSDSRKSCMGATVVLDVAAIHKFQAVLVVRSVLADSVKRFLDAQL